MNTFKAQNVETLSDEDCSIVTFYNTAEGEEGYVTFQLSKEFDAQDYRLGMDGIYLEIGDQSHGGYHAVRRFVFTEQSVVVELEPSAIGLSMDYTPLQIQCPEQGQPLSRAKELLMEMATATSIKVEKPF